MIGWSGLALGKWGIVIPVYGHYRYALSACRSVVASLQSCVLLVLDDATPGWPEVDGWADFRCFLDEMPAGRRYFHRFPKNGGLTRSWNLGLLMARDSGCDVVCVTNSDVLFASNWSKAVGRSLESGWSLVGPVTNAPGTSVKQNVRLYLDRYVPDDNQSSIDRVGEELESRHGQTCISGTLNGFCLVALTETWFRNSWSEREVFRPRNDFDSRGRPNPTPLMTLQEYELQSRWHGRGLKTGFCPGSFVFHYRSVTRGKRYAGRDFFRGR